MAGKHQSLLGVGVYSVPEAARLTEIPSRTIRRWITGYTYTNRQRVTRTSPPLWERQIPPVDDSVALSFRDLLEVRFVQFFRNEGVSWEVIKRAGECAAEIIDDSHPFSTKLFKTDGRRIFADIIHVTGEKSLIDLAARQYELRSFVEPFLFEGVEFADIGIAPIRWWPLGQSRRVVVDPKRSFGQPICLPEAVPTSVLARAYKAEGSIDAVAKWFMVHHKSVEDAVAFENKLSAAA